jgi:hypothetical protein
MKMAAIPSSDNGALNSALMRPGAAKLIRKSLDHWLGFKGGKTGYTWTGASSMWLAIGDGSKVLECLTHSRVLSNAT